MSFILDALKKSESDRQRQTGPSLFEVKITPPRRSLPVWAVAIAVLLGINVVVVSWMLLRRPSAPAAPANVGHPAPQSAAATNAAPPAVPVATSTAAAAPRPASPGAAPVAAPAAPAAPATAAAAHRQDEQPGSPPTGGATPSDYAPAVEPAGGQASGTAQTTTDAVPLYQQVASAPGADLPQLHLDLHVFSESPRDRFVMINMHRLQEGDSLPNGVQVDSIRPDGVVLSYHGSQFLLPRN